MEKKLFLEIKNPDTKIWEYKYKIYIEEITDLLPIRGIPFDISKELQEKLKNYNLSDITFLTLPELRKTQISSLILGEIEIAGLMNKTSCDECVRLIITKE